LFLAPAVSQYLSFFLWPPIFLSSSLKKRGDTTPPIPWGPSQLPLFSHIFCYTYVGPTFHMGIGGDILGYCCSISPNKFKSGIRLFQYHLIGGVVLGDCWRCSHARGWQTGLTERLRWQRAGLFSKVTASVEVLSSWFLLFFPFLRCAKVDGISLCFLQT
jgi:hypothetical protein